MQLTSNMQNMSKAHIYLFTENTNCVCTNTPESAFYINALADVFIPCNLD